MDSPVNLRHFDHQLKGITGHDVIVLPEMLTSDFAMGAAASSLAQDDVMNQMTAKTQQCNALVAGSVALQTEFGSVSCLLLVEPGGMVHLYDKRHLFRMADEHLHYKAGNARVIVEWRGWRILPLVCYGLRLPVRSRSLNDYDLTLYATSWPAPRFLHWQALLTACAIKSQTYVAEHGCVSSDGNDCHYRGGSRAINPQEEIIATAGAHQATRTDAELSMAVLREYREKLPVWQDADKLRLWWVRVVFEDEESRGITTKVRSPQELTPGSFRPWLLFASYVLALP